MDEEWEEEDRKNELEDKHEVSSGSVGAGEEGEWESERVGEWAKLPSHPTHTTLSLSSFGTKTATNIFVATQLH